MNDFTGRVRLDERTAPVGTVRTVTVALDTAQYQMDMNFLSKQQAGGGSGSDDVYGTFNMLMRRKVRHVGLSVAWSGLPSCVGQAPWPGVHAAASS